MPGIKTLSILTSIPRLLHISKVDTKAIFNLKLIPKLRTMIELKDQNKNQYPKNENKKTKRKNQQKIKFKAESKV